MILGEKTREYIARRNRLQYEYAKPYLPIHVSLETTPERELRKEVREALTYLSMDDRRNYRQDCQELYDEVYGDE